MKKIGVLFFVTCWLAICSSSFAQSNEVDTQFQKGVDAFARGDYYTAANIWLIEAYEGSHDAQFNLGVMYLEGKGVAQNREQALFWFNRAAEAGHVEAQYNLGHLFFEDRDNPESLNRAIAWWKRAAEQGFGIAQYNYGRILYFGMGLEKNIEEAKYWMEESAESGLDVATQFIEAHAEELGLVEVRAPATKEVSPESLQAQLQETTQESETQIQTLSEDTDDEIAFMSEDESIPSTQNFNFYHALVDKGSALLYSRFNNLSPVITEIEQETLLRVVNEVGDWLQVQIPGGIPVWIKQQAVIESGNFAEVVTDSTSVLADPSEDSENNIIGQFELGSKHLILTRQDDWYQVQGPETIVGWVNKRYLSIVTSPEQDITTVWQAQRMQRKIKALSSRLSSQQLLVESQKESVVQDQSEEVEEIVNDDQSEEILVASNEQFDA